LSRRNSEPDVNCEAINNLSFFSAEFESSDDKSMTRTAAGICKAKAVVCLVNRQASSFIIMTSEDSGINARQLLERLSSKFEFKGGGRERFASARAVNEKNIIQKVREGLEALS
jgi:alanyl-tRNA synthetase